jgi:hypothetical protein
VAKVRSVELEDAGDFLRKVLDLGSSERGQDGWEAYFAVCEDGVHVVVRHCGSNSRTVRLHEKRMLEAANS